MHDDRLRLRPLARCTLAAAAVFIVLSLAALNWRLYQANRVETVIVQLHFLESSLDAGGAERMQSLFPEGYVFTWALYGLASAQVAQALPPTDVRRSEALQAARKAVARIESEHAKATFVRDMEPAYGAFYSAWSLYLRSVVLRASGTAADPPPFDLKTYEADCRRFAAVLAESESPFLPSYPGSAWPADTGVGVAALAIRDAVLGARYQTVIANWLQAVRQRLDSRYGAMAHAADATDGKPLGVPRGESLALLSYVLVDVDPVFARQQYAILRQHFVAYVSGIPGVREYPHGIDGPADIDSGPILFGFSGPASVVGIGAALANGDTELATDLLASVEALGFPIEIAGQRRYAGGIVPVGDAFLAWARSAPVTRGSFDYVPILPFWWRLPWHAFSLILAAVVCCMASRVIRNGRAVRRPG